MGMSNKATTVLFVVHLLMFPDSILSQERASSASEFIRSGVEVEVRGSDRQTLTGDSGGRTVTSTRTTVGAFFDTPLGQNTMLQTLLSYEYVDLDTQAGAFLPPSTERLQLDLGLAHRWNESWGTLLKISPFLSGESLNSEALGVSGLLGIGWKLTENFELLSGARFDSWSRYPIIPLIGARWNISDSLRIDATIPRALIRWQASPAWELQFGARFTNRTYRMGDSFGSDRDRPELNGGRLESSAIAVIVGSEWTVSEHAKLIMELGRDVWQRYEFEEQDHKFSSPDSWSLGLKVVWTF